MNQARAVPSSSRCFSVLWHLPQPLELSRQRGGAGPSCLSAVQHLFLSLSVLKEHVVGAQGARQS